MSELAIPDLFIPPSDIMKGAFRRAVTEAFGREPIDGKITVTVERIGYSATIVSLKTDAASGQLMDQAAWYLLEPDGSLSKDGESEPAYKRLASELRNNSVNQDPSEYEQKVKRYAEATGCSEAEAKLKLLEERLTTSSGRKAAGMLLASLDEMAEKEARGEYEVDAFELAGVIQKVRDNFPAMSL